MKPSLFRSQARSVTEAIKVMWFVTDSMAGLGDKHACWEEDTKMMCSRLHRLGDRKEETKIKWCARAFMLFRGHG